MRIAWPALSLLLAVSAAAADRGPADRGPADRGPADRGPADPGAVAPGAARQQALSDLLIQDCGSCHGLTLAGGLGPALVPERLAGHDVDTLSRVILDGLPGTAMPPWRAMLSADEARWIAQRLLDGFKP